MVLRTRACMQRILLRTARGERNGRIATLQKRGHPKKSRPHAGKAGQAAYPNSSCDRFARVPASPAPQRRARSGLGSQVPIQQVAARLVAVRQRSLPARRLHPEEPLSVAWQAMRRLDPSLGSTFVLPDQNITFSCTTSSASSRYASAVRAPRARVEREPQIHALRNCSSISAPANQASMKPASKASPAPVVSTTSASGGTIV